jgi:hypothetical protein
MLDKYLADTPTITEKLSQSPERAAEAVVEKVNGTKEFLQKCHASWEKKA